MKFFESRSVRRFFIAALVPMTVAASAGTAAAQYGRQQQRQSSRNELFEWQGRVDREIRIEVRRNGASLIEVGSNERARRSVRTVSALPSRPGTVYVRVLEGRGKVDVIQQPSARNGYTAVVRLRDPAGGASRYRIAAYFESDRNSRGNGRRGF
jgi:hypothetical protein